MELTLQTNKYQSNIKDYEEKLPKEAFDNIYKAIEDLEYLKRLISIDRKYVEDLPKDDEGAAIIDISNPHILKDMDYFRQPIIKFLKSGKYTEALPSKYKKSAWALFWKEEGRKCLSRVINPDTGEWIPGDFYFYLNYSPIMRVVQDDKGEEIDRVMGFPDFYDGDYLYYHYIYKARHYRDEFVKGMHGVAMKCRGRGYSLKEGSRLAKRFILGDTILSQTKVRAIALASEKEYLVKDGILNKFVDVITHCADHTGWGKSVNKNAWQTMEFHAGYTTKDGFARGRRNEVIGVSVKDNPGKARGKRCNLMIYEEFGKFPNLLETYRTNRPSVEAGPISFGQKILIGTGGEVGAAFEGAAELIYNPDGYRVYSIPNIYDKNMTGNTRSAFFSPEVLNLESCYDIDGNSDIIKALAHIMYERFKVKYNTSKPDAITGHIAEHPISIAESIMRKEGSIFPVTEIKEYLDHCKSLGTSFFKTHYVGELVPNHNGEIKWVPTDKTPLRSFKLSASDNKHGSLEIFEMPKRDAEGVIKNRYILGCDPYDDDTGTSSGNIWVFDTFNQHLVAEYTGRPKFADDFFEICRKLTIFYAGKLNYENNKKGLFAYFSQRNCLNLLADNPSTLVDKEMMKGNQYGNKSKGVHATDSINAYARRLIRDWLLKPASDIFQEYDAEGNQITEKLNLHCVKSLPLLEELMAWDGEVNCDRVSGLGMVMILNEEYKKLNQVYSSKEVEKDFASDEYFNQYMTYSFSYGTPQS